MILQSAFTRKAPLKRFFIRGALPAADIKPFTTRFLNQKRNITKQTNVSAESYSPNRDMDTVGTSNTEQRSNRDHNGKAIRALARWKNVVFRASNVRNDCTCHCHRPRQSSSRSVINSQPLVHDACRSRVHDLATLEDNLMEMSSLLYKLVDLNRTLLLQLRDDKDDALKTAARLKVARTSSHFL